MERGKSKATTAANQERIEKKMFLRRGKFHHQDTQKSLMIPIYMFPIYIYIYVVVVFFSGKYPIEFSRDFIQIEMY